MKQIVLQNEIKEVTVCPYCGTEQSQYESPGCCGESSAHFVTAFKYQDEIYFDYELEVVQDETV